MTSKVDGAKGFNQLLKGLGEGEEAPLPGLQTTRVHFDEQRALPEECFDLIAKALSGSSAATTQCVFSSQLGQGRSTLGMVIASIVKAMQMITKLNKMVEAGMAEKSWAANIIKSKFEDPIPSEDLKDHFMRGEWEEHKELREMIANGKDRLEWTRKVDQGQVSKLRAELQGDDYKVKLGGLVSQLYKLAFQTYHDIPRGPIKDNLMRKLACKTLMEILPPEVGTKISEEITEKKLSVDFDTVVGLVVG